MAWNYFYGFFRIARFDKKMNKILQILPLFFILFITLILLIFLLQEKNPNKPPSALINEELPEFTLINIFDDNDNLSKTKLLNKQIIINFFASWCTPCIAEHEFFFKLKEKNENILIIGINYKDKKSDAVAFLQEHGNPYDFVGQDQNGNIGLEFGVFGLPETFLTNNKTKIIYKQLGPITKKILNNEIIPLLH